MPEAGSVIIDSVFQEYRASGLLRAGSHVQSPLRIQAVFQRGVHQYSVQEDPCSLETVREAVPRWNISACDSQYSVLY